MIYFGSWGNSFYALDRNTGKLIWERKKYTNRMLSPAAVWPVATDGKVFIVAPDRHMTALDAKTGAEIWDSGQYSCRESIGISQNRQLVYIKNMTEGKVIAFSTSENKQKPVWECDAGLDYEIGPSPITEDDRFVFIPTGNGEIIAIGNKSHAVDWRFKLTNALINGITPLKNNRLIATSLDGKIVCLEY